MIDRAGFDLRCQQAVRSESDREVFAGADRTRFEGAPCGRVYRNVLVSGSGTATPSTPYDLPTRAPAPGANGLMLCAASRALALLDIVSLASGIAYKQHWWCDEQEA